MSASAAGATGAAFFDLDRTLLAGASGQVFAMAMRDAGLAPPALPGEGLLFSVFNALGETLPSMALARQAVRLAKGRSQDAVRRVAESAADHLIELVQPQAAALFDEHRAAGRPIVLATTTPHDLVAPLARRLGLDDVVATRYGVDGAGRYDGSLDGPFVWSTGKLSAVRDWARRHGVDLSASYAYSDSVYDTPLLGAVGHPHVVNPDPRMAVMAAARRWPTIDLGPARSPSGLRLPLLDVELQRLLLPLAHPALFPYARFDIAGAEHIPADGPAIIVANHRSYFDVAAMAVLLARAGRAVRFLGKREVFDAPVIGQVAAALGGIPVDRATGSDAPLRAAEAALAAGDVVALMPQGTIPRGAGFYDPVLRGRWGAARLAGASRAPVIPVGLWGTERVWPRCSRLPNVSNLADPPQVTIAVGPAVPLVYRSADADTKRIMAAIMSLLPAESRVRRTPTDDEIRRASPPGTRADGTREAERRPGTD
ncbi:MAG: HAD-IB family hydrolase [Ilumatobacteraceae bacterium]